MGLKQGRVGPYTTEHMSVLFNFGIIYFLFFGHAHSLQALSSLIRDWTRAPCNRRMESRPLDHQEIPAIILYQSYLEIKKLIKHSARVSRIWYFAFTQDMKEEWLMCQLSIYCLSSDSTHNCVYKKEDGHLHTFLLTVAVMWSFVSRRCCVLESPFRRKGHFYWAWCAFKAGCCISDSLQQCSQLLRHLVSLGIQASSAPSGSSCPG